MMSEYKIIDFRGRFSKSYMNWYLKNKDKVSKLDQDRQDDLYYSMYGKWLEEPKDWLDGKSPANYFRSFTDDRYLLSALIDYIKEGIEIPEFLTDEIVERGDSLYPILLNLIYTDKEEDLTPQQFEQLLSESMILISRMGKEQPTVRYIQILSSIKEESELGETIAELIREEAPEYRDKIISVYSTSEQYGRMAFLDILSSLGKNDDTFDLIKEELEGESPDLVFLCGCINKTQDERFIDVLESILKNGETDYFSFKEISNTIEELGGNAPDEKDFSGDALYDYLKEHDEI